MGLGGESDWTLGDMWALGGERGTGPCVTCGPWGEKGTGPWVTCGPWGGERDWTLGEVDLRGRKGLDPR